MTHMEMGCTRSSVVVKGVSPLEGEIWKHLLLLWCGPGFEPGAFWIDMVSAFPIWERGIVQSGGLGSLRAETADTTFVELHFVLVTNRFNFRSMRKQRLLVIVINLNNESSLCFLLRGLIIGVFSFCGLAKKC